jgi:hypothetical protein
MAESGIEPGTSWLVSRNSDHQATRLVRKKFIKSCIWSVALYGSETRTIGENVDRGVNALKHGAGEECTK